MIVFCWRDGEAGVTADPLFGPIDMIGHYSCTDFLLTRFFFLYYHEIEK
jgi:hypothetical protein